ncbi:MAG: discoidin domain-containing protein [Gammaproteobacteria bacterium]|nr:discoidin domain-containing protein [Gammaproteobacteria bacterium]
MRKQIIEESIQKVSPAENREWLDLEQLVQVELTSEDEEHPIESALTMNTGSGWRAQHSGKQTIRLLFDKPQRIRRIQVVFEENGGERTQEFVLRYSADNGATFHEIVRQQYNFSPPDNTRELEDYIVEFDGLTMLELIITPNISGGENRASLAQLRLADR